MEEERSLLTAEGNPVMRAACLAADLIVLNLLMLLTSLPVVTLGASASAGYTAYRLRREEGALIPKVYFQAFRLNLKEAAGTFLILSAAAGLLGFDLIWAFTSVPGGWRILPVMILGSLLILVISTGIVAFPLISGYRHSVIGHIKNAFVLAAGHPVKMGVLWVLRILPAALVFLYVRAYPAIVFLCAVSVGGIEIALTDAVLRPVFEELRS